MIVVSAEVATGFEQRRRGGGIAAVHSNEIMIHVCPQVGQKDVHIILAVDEPARIYIGVVIIGKVGRLERAAGRRQNIVAL